MKVRTLPLRDQSLAKKLNEPDLPKGRAWEVLAPNCKLCGSIIYKYTGWDFILDGRNGSQPICAMCVHERKTQ